MKRVEEVLTRRVGGILTLLVRGLGSLRRAGWGVADQACSSLTNFLPGIIVARQLDPEQFGAFTLAFATYGLALSASGALASQPLLIRFSGAPDAVWRPAAARSCGAALAIGCVTGVACVVVALLCAGPVRAAYLALGVTLPGLLLQDNWRMAFFAAGRGRDASLNDCIWAAVLIPSLLMLFAADRLSIWSVMLAWGFGANVAALAALAQIRLLPRPERAWEWLAEHRDLGPRFLAESVVLTGSTQVQVGGIAAVTGLTAVAGIRGARLLLGPAHVFSLGLKLVMLPEAVVALRGSVAAVRRMCARQSASMVAGTLAWGLLLLLVPERLGVWVLGPTWVAAREVLFPLTLAYAAGAAIVGASAGLRALGAARHCLRARIGASVLQVSAAVGGAAVGGARLAAWGLAVAGALSVVVFWRSFLDALEEQAPVEQLQALEPVELPG